MFLIGDRLRCLDARKGDCALRRGSVYLVD